jgi:ATP-dependent RNA helicase DeaD
MSEDISKKTETTPIQELTFRDLGLSEKSLAAIEQKGFTKPSAIQAQAIPLLLKRERDIIGQAKTGTGKTAAFALPMIETIDMDSKTVQAMVLAPTRELAIQVASEIESLAGNSKLSVLCVYGGAPIDSQIRRLKRGVHIVVGTPGRVIDHLKRKTLKLSEITHLILDEADEMLNMGFVEDIEEIISYSNEEKQVMLFSATMPDRIRFLAEKYLKDYDHVKVQEEKNMTSTNVEQMCYEVRVKDKVEALCRVIEIQDKFYGIVFCRTRADVDNVASQLQRRGHSADGLHGDISQGQREKILQRFKKRQINILVATDIAARGIDVNNLTHVINYSLPHNSEAYVHRIGRTGRAGNKGVAISFITPKEFGTFRHFQRQLKHQIPEQSLPGVGEIIKAKKLMIKNNLEAIYETAKEGYHLEFAKQLLEGRDPEQVVAGLLKYSFNKILEATHYNELNQRTPNRDNRDSRRDKTEFREGRGHRNESLRRAGDRESGSRTKPMTRLFVFKGRKDNMGPKELVNFLTHDNNVSPNAVRHVEISELFSFVSVPASDADAIIKTFGGGEGGRAMVERAKEKRGDDRGRREGGDNRGYRRGGEARHRRPSRRTDRRDRY